MSSSSVPRSLLFGLLMLTALPISRAFANPEPPAMYDAEVHGMGGAGLAVIDSPAAVVHNPANLAGVDSIQAELAITNMLVSLNASFSGPGREQHENIFVPLPFIGLTAPVGKRFTIGGSLYLAMGFGGQFSGVRRYGTGRPCIDSIDDALDVGLMWPPVQVNEAARDADYCPSEPRDESVTLAIAEFAVPVAFRLRRNLFVGAALRFPYGVLSQQTSQDIFGALSPDNPQGNFGLGYAQVRSSMSGFGTPGVLLGVTYAPKRWMRMAFTYRSQTRVHMTGTTQMDLRSNELIGGLLNTFGDLDVGWLSGTDLIPGLTIQSGDTVNTLVDRITGHIPSSTDWFMPHAFEFGVASELLDGRLLLAADFRIQLHRYANRGLTIHLDDELIESMGMGEMTQRFDWKNVYGLQIGAQLRVADDVVVRLGGSTANSATPRTTVTQFGVPPGQQVAINTGVGLTFGKFVIDAAASYGYGGNYSIAQRPPDAQGNFTYEPNCRPGQTIKLSCPGNYHINSYFLALSLTYRGDVIERRRVQRTASHASRPASEATPTRAASRRPSTRSTRAPRRAGAR